MDNIWSDLRKPVSKHYVQLQVSEINDGKFRNFYLPDQLDRPVLMDGAGQTYEVAFESVLSTDAPEANLSEPMTSLIRHWTFMHPFHLPLLQD